MSYIEKNRYLHNFIEAFTKNYANFKGRARRKERAGDYLFYALAIRYFRCFCFYRYWSNTFW